MDKLLARVTSKCRLLANFTYFPRGFEPCIIDTPSPTQQLHEPNTEHDPKEDGFLWGVPKRRRSVQVRWCRNMGAQNWVWKMLKPKTNLRICETCGNHYEAKHLCRTCYTKVKQESEIIREAIEAKLGNQAEDQSVVVMYENEKEALGGQTFKDQTLVEIPKARPPWFSRNLLQKTTAAPDHDTTTVVPKSNLS